MRTIFQDKYIQNKLENLKVLLINSKKHFTIRPHRYCFSGISTSMGVKWWQRIWRWKGDLCRKGGFLKYYRLKAKQKEKMVAEGKKTKNYRKEFQAHWNTVRASTLSSLPWAVCPNSTSGGGGQQHQNFLTAVGERQEKADHDEANSPENVYVKGDAGLTVSPSQARGNLVLGAQDSFWSMPNAAFFPQGAGTFQNQAHEDLEGIIQWPPVPMLKSQ